MNGYGWLTESALLPAPSKKIKITETSVNKYF